jgi:hypothetical protein
MEFGFISNVAANEGQLMETHPNVVIVSAFGRGNWMAAEIKSTLKVDVHLIDVTDSLGRWAPEDWEGPFGLFQTEQLTQSQQVRLDEEDYADATQDGFCIWLKSGPIDMRGSHSSYLLDNREVSQNVQEYIRLFETMPKKRKLELLKELQNAPLHKTWLAQLAHSVASSVSPCHYSRPIWSDGFRAEVQKNLWTG